MDFVALTIGLLIVGFLLLAMLARAFQDHSVADLLDWKPTRSPEVEVQNEIDDVQQMIDAQNELRRKRGAKEITEADVQRQAQEDQAVRARGKGAFAQQVVDDQEGAEMPPMRPKTPPAERAGAKKRRAAAKRKPAAKTGSGAAKKTPKRAPKKK